MKALKETKNEGTAQAWEGDVHIRREKSIARTQLSINKKSC